MTIVLVAHGTRNPQGLWQIGQWAKAVEVRLGRRTLVAFVDVLGPSPAEVLTGAAVAGKTVTLVPLFLSAGYHVREDLPAQVEIAAHPAVTVLPPVGYGPRLPGLMVDLLRAQGWAPGAPLVLGTAGSTHPAAQADMALAAAALSETVGQEVAVGYAALATPTVQTLVHGLGAEAGRPVFIASYLLAEGYFAQRLRAVEGARGVSAPIGHHPGFIELLCEHIRGGWERREADRSARGRAAEGAHRP